MLKRIIIIIIFFGLGAWAISYWYDQSTNQDQISKVFSKIVTKNQVGEESVNSTDIIELTNKERLAVGLPPLSTNPLLGDSAEIKVDDMIKRQYFEHQSPSGEGVSDLGARVGYDYVILGENLAMGTFTSSSDIVTAWMNSPGHKANILNKKYQEIGVSVKRGVYEDKEVWFAVQHFGTGRSVCPTIDENLKNEITAMNRDLKEEEGIINSLKKDLESPGASALPSYQSDIQTFNKNVDDYNIKLQASRQKIEKYNVEVKDFNRCIATFQ